MSVFTKFLACHLLLLGAFASGAGAQPTTSPAANPITLNFPENTELKLLIQYVSERLNINILYDEQLASQRVTLKSPAEVPQESLLGLLESALKMKGLLLVDGEQPGWKQIVQAQNLIAAAGPATQPTAETPSMSAVTQVFTLKHAFAQQVDQVIRPFLTQPGGNSLAIQDQKLIIVTDLAGNLRRIESLVQMLDQPHAAILAEFIPIRHVDAEQLAKQVSQYFAAIQKTRGQGTSTDVIEISAEPRTNHLVLIGTRARIDEAIEISKRIDVPLDLLTKSYRLQSVSPERIDRLLAELIGATDARRPYQSAVDREANLLIVTAPSEIHERVEALRQELDVTTPAEQSPMRFYKLTNSTAADVLATIQALEGGSFDQVELERDTTPASLPKPLEPGANRPPPEPGQPPLPPPVYHGEQSKGDSIPPAEVNTVKQRQTIRAKDAIVTADPNTNTIIVVAAPSVQNVYERLIQMLDKRRPQVLVECTIVTLDTSNDFSFGVELAGRDSTNGTDIITFSSFGLSRVDRDTGELALRPGAGFNGAVVDPDVGEVIVRALAGSGRAEVFAAPRVLVNDNATGTLSSVSESPFTSVNASDTVSTTSFGGYASAGTTVSVTPHIAEGDHLNLEYMITLNNFTGSGGNGIPPPRQTDEVESQVTIPDGQMIIVGGLNRRNYSQTITGIPFLKDIPWVQLLFSNRVESSNKTTLFVFIRPRILRDDQFKDLKFLSERAVEAAQLPSDLPSSKPLNVR